MIELINLAIGKGAKLYGSISGGKDGQAMAKSLFNWGFQLCGLIHADLGRVEWKESFQMCELLSKDLNAPLYVVRRSDGLDMLAYWQRRMNQLHGTGKPFWSSASNRYCTSDLKRDPINVFLRNCGHNFTISCEGIRAAESTARAQKSPLTIRERITSTYYKGMTVEEAIVNYNPRKRLSLTWYPIFNFSLNDVLATYNINEELLKLARDIYKAMNIVAPWFPLHPAYVYGNDRVSCMICVLGSLNDIKNGAFHNPGLLNEMIEMENFSNCTFKKKWSLKSLTIT